MKRICVLSFVAFQLCLGVSFVSASDWLSKTTISAGYRFNRPHGVAVNTPDLEVDYRFVNHPRYAIVALVDAYRMPLNPGSSQYRIESSVGVEGHLFVWNDKNFKPFLIGGLNYIYTTDPVSFGINYGVGVDATLFGWPLEGRVDQLYWDTYRKDLRIRVGVGFPICEQSEPVAKAPVVVPVPPIVVAPVVATAPAPVVATVSAAVIDADNDGVADKVDQCPGTPSGVTVDAYGCAVDSDKDLIPDYLDACPGTEATAAVDEKGCVIGIKNTVQFRSGQSSIDSKYFPLIEEISKMMAANPKLTIELQGYTDSFGSKEYNLKLSIARAKSVENVLRIRYKVDAARLKTVGFGSEKLLVNSQVREDNSVNRRVEVRVLFNEAVPTASEKSETPKL